MKAVAGDGLMAKGPLILHGPGSTALLSKRHHMRLSGHVLFMRLPWRARLWGSSLDVADSAQTDDASPKDANLLPLDGE